MATPTPAPGALSAAVDDVLRLLRSTTSNQQVTAQGQRVWHELERLFQERGLTRDTEAVASSEPVSVPEHWSPQEQRFTSDTRFRTGEVLKWGGSSATQGPSDLVRLDWLPEHHPAAPGRGCFARTTLLSGQHIIDYTGELQVGSVQDSDVGASDFVANLTQVAYTQAGRARMELNIDAVRGGNESRFINDPKGLKGQSANVELAAYVDTQTKRVALGVFALTDIKPSQELFMSYGPHYWEAQRHKKRRRIPSKRVQP